MITPDDPTQSVPFPDPVAVTATAQHCANCGALLATDQRYCLQCGERHGEPRLPVMTGRPEATATVTTTTTAAAPRGLRPSANTGLIAGVGTLLIALGVGVVIGRSSQDDGRPARAGSGVQVVTVAGGAPAAASASTTAPAATADATAASSTAKAKGDAKSSSKGGDAKKDASDATSAVKSGGAVGKSKGTVVKIGQKGSGAGYKDGKFTGDFFGG